MTIPRASKALVAAVAERGFSGVFALTQPKAFALLRREFQGLECGSGMGAVTKRLVLGAATAAPVVCFSRFNVDFGRFFRRGFRLSVHSW